jgi:hypothetical protein
VRNFLQLRQNDPANQSRALVDRRADGNSPRSFGEASRSGNVADNARSVNADLRARIDGSRKQADETWARRFGNGKNDRGERSPRGLADVSRDADWSRRFNDSDRRGNDGGFTGRGLGDRDFKDRNYQQWRNNAWRGEHGKGRDHRDRSGRWKDGDRFVAAHQIRDHWRGHRNYKNLPFRGGWWSNHDRHRRNWHHWDHFAHRHHRPYYWWSWCPAPRLTSWVTFGWTTPYYWDYGPGEYIYCYDDVIYVNGVWFQPAPVYYQDTVVLAQRVPDWTAEQAAQVEWLPLGVFAVARDGVADSNVVVQLAVTKDSVIGGTVFNKATGATFAVQGTVDKDTQRAVWSYDDGTNGMIVMETSIYNLTQPEATGLVHYGPDNIQVIQLVRLEEPSADATVPQQPALLQPAVGP